MNSQSIFDREHKEGLGALLTQIIAAHKPTRPQKEYKNTKMQDHKIQNLYLETQRRAWRFIDTNYSRS